MERMRWNRRSNHRMSRWRCWCAGLEDDAALRKKMNARSLERAYSFDYIIKHVSQHYFYHASQISYLRRAPDRDWQPPLKQWETAVDTISEHTWKE